MEDKPQKKVFPVRKNIRLPAYDYRENGSYFVTICIFHKQPLLARKKVSIKEKKEKSQPVGAGFHPRPQTEHFSDSLQNPIVLTPIGKMVAQTIQYVGSHFEGVRIENAVVMPNHIHLLLALENPEAGNRLSLSDVVGRLKSYTTKRFFEMTGKTQEPLWQRGFYDHVIRNQTEWERAWEYIEYNALKIYPKKDL